METSVNNVDFLRFHIQHRESVPAIERMRLSCVDVTYCMEGRMDYIVNGEAVTLRGGDAIIMPIGTVRERLFTDIPNYYASFNLLTDDDELLGEYRVVRKCVDADTVYMTEAFGRCIREASAYGKQKCLALFSFLYHKLAEKAINGGNPYVCAVKQYIMNHLSERITLAELAAEVHVAPQYLCAVFKKHTGMTVMEHVNAERVAYAKRLILTHGLPLYKIARRCGFSDYNSFSHTFKRLEGISAAQYRRSALVRSVGRGD